jgi:hypothetical protein
MSMAKASFIFGPASRAKLSQITSGPWMNSYQRLSCPCGLCIAKAGFSVLSERFAPTTSDCERGGGIGSPNSRSVCTWPLNCFANRCDESSFESRPSSFPHALPRPLPHLRHILPVLPDVLPMLHQLIPQLLLQIRRLAPQFRQSINHIPHQMIPIQII